MPIAIGQITITDQNDFWIGAEAPDPAVYTLWLDTSIDKFKRWNGETWGIVNDMDGKIEDTNDRIIGVNLCPNSLINEGISTGDVVERFSVNLTAGKQYCLSVNGNIANSGGAKLRTVVESPNEDVLLNVLSTIYDSTSSGAFVAPVSGIYRIYSFPSTTTTGTVHVNWYKLELGNRPTKWIEAPEDTAARIAELDYLKPALAGSTEINGGLVAMNLLVLKSSANGSHVGGMSGLYDDPIAIWAGGTHQNAVDLLAKFIVLKDGSIYGAGGKFKALANGKLDMNFTTPIKTYNPDGTELTNPITQTIRLSDELGEVSVSNSNNEVAKITSQGIIANKAGTQALPSTSGIELKASIVGLGFGNLNKDASFGGTTNSALIGVYGRSYNTSSNPAPSYGGWFDKLRANGLVLGTKIIYNSTISTNINVYLSSVVTMVISTTTAYNDPSVWLPTDAYVGHVVFVRQWGGGRVNVGCNPGKIYDDSSSEYSYPVDNGQMAMFTYIGEFGGYPTWLINRMSF